MKKLMPMVAGLAVAALTIPAASVAADAAGIVDQASAWIVTTVAAAATGLIAAAVTKVTGAVLDAKARDTIQLGLERASALGLEWLLARISQTATGAQIRDAIGQMLPYLDEGNPGSLGRFKMGDGQGNRAHLESMARAALIDRLTKVAPDKLDAALAKAIPR